MKIPEEKGQPLHEDRKIEEDKSDMKQKIIKQTSTIQIKKKSFMKNIPLTLNSKKGLNIEQTESVNM